ncbi:hypothetical protein KBY66_02590 [Synechococcus sp. Tobar12-5m-g]|jgi:hypothetical protein|uniref:hypothetical protein n=1 Tax=unclassified Synechococcus TaxID=2626047 RepID=UPI0020CC329D|nr:MULTISPECIES: hypothetical protein [unclassified Synechococcus]MCP9771522.1 hypothetical protein [Synechococcus sp. Tobar12-5m-g]MCP9872462.1 hypothetical protein [Synechococcus sp. Cruz CV-v-12]
MTLEKTRVWLRSIALVSGLLLAVPLASRAESSTAESIWDESNARQRALQQVPQGATVSGTSCESFSVGMGNTRYRCTVTFTTSPGPTPKSP